MKTIGLIFKKRTNKQTLGDNKDKNKEKENNKDKNKEKK